MIDLQQALGARFPRWFEGPRKALSVPLVRGLSRLSRVDRINEFLASHGHLRGLAFVDAAMAFLRCRYLVDHVERERIPERGRVLIVANHPMGAIDALALLKLVGDVRRDVRVLANDLLATLPGLSDLIIPLRVLGGRPSAESLRLVDEALAREEAVVIFPAGEVSRLTPFGVRDGRWRPGFLRFAERSGAPVLPVRIGGRNSAWFYAWSAMYKPLGTALLPREMFARDGRRVELRVGHARGIDDYVTERGRRQQALAAVRRALQHIGTRAEAQPTQQPIAHSGNVRDLLSELARLERVGETSDGMRIFVGRLASDSALMREIARLRELTFRAVGEGTGKRLDTDRYDTWYDHIIVWDAEAGEIAGAYRAARGADVLAARGMTGLYTNSLFEYDPNMRPMIEQGMELGRSFVQPKYWGTRSLDYLWFGIGAYLRRYPEVRYLFGPVSISAALPLAAREHLVGYYQHFYGEAQGLARSRHPFRFADAAPNFAEADPEASFRALKLKLDALGARVPTLYKQYTELCEPGGARFLSFGVDPDFAGSIDGLILVDLARVKPKKRARYLDAPTPRALGATP